MASQVFQPMEDEFLQQAETAKKEYDGNQEALKDLSQEAFTRSLDAARSLIEKIKADIPQRRINYLMLDYFRDAAAGCNMPYNLGI